MKHIVLGLLMVTAAWSSADAKGGKGVVPIPADYDYTREKAKGYKKDYCEDAVGNHVYCRATNRNTEEKVSAN